MIRFYEKKKFYHEPPYNVISTSLFNLGEGGYRRFPKYLSGVESWLKFLDKNFPIEEYNLYLRVYTDMSVLSNEDWKKTLLKINQHPRLQIVIFDCPKMKSFKDQKGHAYFFPSIARLFPAFDIKDNDTDLVFTRDLDLYEGEDFESKYHEIVKKIIHNKNILNWVLIWVGYYPAHSTLIDNKWAPDGEQIPMSNFCTRIKMPNHILTDFLHDLDTGAKDNPLFKTLIERAKRHTKVSSRMNKLRPQFFYGIDEIFLNGFILPYLSKFKNKSIISKIASDPYVIIGNMYNSIKYWDTKGELEEERRKSGEKSEQPLGTQNCSKKSRGEILNELRRIEKLTNEKELTKELGKFLLKFKDSGCIKHKYASQIVYLAEHPESKRTSFFL